MGKWTEVPLLSGLFPYNQQPVVTSAKSLQSCPTLCDPTDSSPPGSTGPGTLQARHWSGLPFPFPMHESEKWKWSRSVVSDSSRPYGLQPTRLLGTWDFPGQSTGVGCHCLLQINSLGLVKLRPLTSPEGQSPMGPVALVIRADLRTI